MKELELGLNFKKGRISSATIYSDAMYADLIQEISSKLEGTIFKIDNIVENINQIPVDKEGEAIIEDIKKWLKSKSI